MEIITRIKSLKLPEKKFVVLGSAILEIKGIRKAGDLDIMVPKEIFGELKKDSSWKYTRKIGRLGDAIDLLERDNVQLYFHIYGREDFDYFYNDPSRTEVIDGITFCSLSNLMEIKSERWDREKDKNDVLLIKEYLKDLYKNGFSAE
jgi:hypothetical protein